METTSIDQKLDKMICVQNDSSLAKVIAEEIAPLIEKQFKDAESAGGVVLIMRSYPAEGTCRWKDFVSWQLVKE